MGRMKDETPGQKAVPESFGDAGHRGQFFLKLRRNQCVEFGGGLAGAGSTRQPGNQV